MDSNDTGLTPEQQDSAVIAEMCERADRHRREAYDGQRVGTLGHYVNGLEYDSFTYAALRTIDRLTDELARVKSERDKLHSEWGYLYEIIGPQMISDDDGDEGNTARRLVADSARLDALRAACSCSFGLIEHAVKGIEEGDHSLHDRTLDRIDEAARTLRAALGTDTAADGGAE